LLQNEIGLNCKKHSGTVLDGFGQMRYRGGGGSLFLPHIISYYGHHVKAILGY
jgi:hypothetical protein